MPNVLVRVKRSTYVRVGSSGITGLVNPVNHLLFITEPVDVPDEEGAASWDTNTHLLKLRSDIPGSYLNVGLEDWTRVRNLTGEIIPNGTAVIGFASSIPKVFDIVPGLASPGQAAITGVTTSELGIYNPLDPLVEHGQGWAATRGFLDGYDTTNLASMKPIYLGADPLKAGGITLVPPSPPNYPIPLGYSLDQQVNGNLYIFADNPFSIISAVDAAYASGDPTGFHAGNTIGITNDPVARTITYTGDNLKYSWRGQVKELVSPWTSPPHPDVLDTGYFLYSKDGENFIWTTIPWAFDVVMAAFVWYGTIDKWAIREPHGLMPWQCHQEFHETNGTYRESGGDVADYVLDSTIAAERRPTVSATSVKDEDNITVLPSLVDSLYSRGYLTGAGIFTFAKASADININAGVQPQYNFFDGVNWIQDVVPQNQRMSIYLAAIPVTEDDGSQAYRYVWVQGQSYGTLTDQKNTTTGSLNLGNFQALFTESVFIEQIIIRYQGGDWFWEESIKLTGTRSQQIGSPSGNYLSAVAHDDTSSGAGTAADPLIILSGTPRGGNAGDGIQKNSSADFDFGILKNNLFAIIPPTVNDDAVAGYGVDSRWIDQAGLSIYQCIDSTVGAAVWVNLTGGGGGSWELIDSRALSNSAAVLFDLVDEHVKFELINVENTRKLELSLSSDGGASYLNNHYSRLVRNNSNTSAFSSAPAVGQDSMIMSDLLSSSTLVNYIEVFNILGASQTQVKGRIREPYTNISNENTVTGSYGIAIATDKLKFWAGVAGVLASGTINMYKRTY